MTLAETEPPVWRRLLVPAEMTLASLHDTLQVVMGWMYAPAMTLRPVLACAALLVACSRNADAVTPLHGGGYSYLVTPSGHMYRVLQAGPMIGGEGKQIATVVAYAGETREIARIGSDAEEIVAALAPEMELGGETSIIVQANVGYDPRKMISKSVSYNTVFERRNGRWRRLSPKDGEPKELDGVDGSPRPPDDPSFPFAAAKMKGAADAAAKWLALIDAGKVDASLAAMSETSRSRVSPDQWRALVTERSGLAAGARRVELYRMQTRNGNVPMPPGGGAVVQYDVRSAQGGRFVERVTLLNEKDGWRPVGYAFQSLPAG